MRNQYLRCLFFCSMICSVSYSQIPAPLGSGEIFLRLKKLNVLGTVLYLAAHPDDENSRLIAYLQKDRLYRTGYLSMTRGDGGQNLIGDEQGVELGLIRTQEMLAARRIDGAEQFFSRAFDFGFSKSTEEALNMWGKEKALSDVVWVIRRFQPDVVITRFPEDVKSAFHGHHAASAVLAHEAFTAAADPTRFPEQFKYGVKPWQVKRVLWNTFNFGGIVNTTSENQLKIDVGAYNPILGKSYGEIAAESRTEHKSQGAALTRARGQSMEYFRSVAGDYPTSDIMEGIVTNWSRVDGGAKIEPMVNKLLESYSLLHPEETVPGLVQLYKAISGMPDGYWRTQKLNEVRQLIEACSGLWLAVTVSKPYVIRGDSMKLNIEVNNRLNAKISLQQIRMKWFDTAMQQELAFNKNYFFSRSLLVPAEQPITQPYWLAEEMSPGSYNVKDQTLIGQPQSDPAFEVEFTLRMEGQDLVFRRAVSYGYTDPVKGDQYQPVTVLPQVSGRFDPELVVFTDGEKKPFQVITKNYLPAVKPPTISLTNAKELGLRQTGNGLNLLNYEANPMSKQQATYRSELVAEKNGKTDTLQELNTISYDHIPRIDYFRRAKATFVVADVKIAGKRIGYIEGAGDKVPQALQQMGYEVVILKEKDITQGNLRQFDAVLTGVRSFGVHPWLTEKQDVLLDYVKDGGNFIVQYERNNPFGGPRLSIGPYPFVVSGLRVTDENAKVTFLQPNHPVLNFPNRITDKDFDGWIQERGIYFADRMDSNYQAIFSMHDPGEPDQKGSLIIADFGKGKFVYTGLVFFRELPAGVPGAYRLFANIIALNYKRGF